MLKAYAGHWDLVTGASLGIGAEFAGQLAAWGMHCVLVARRGIAVELLANVACLAELTLSAAKEMVRRGHGGIINIGSIVSFHPVGYMGVYAASKVYVLHFSEALWAELRPRGVTVTTLCPGTTRTEFFDHSGVPGWAEQNRRQDVRTVVRTGLEAFDSGRQYAISGWKNYLTSIAVRLGTRTTHVAAHQRSDSHTHKRCPPSLTTCNRDSSPWVKPIASTAISPPTQG